MNFNLATEVNSIEGVVSYLLNNLPGFATNSGVALSLRDYYTAETCNATFAALNNPRARRRG